MHNPVFSRLAVLLFLGAFAACKTTANPATSNTPILQPGAPGQATRTIDEKTATDLSKVGATEADIKFMQGMIGHHAQAVEMVDLLNTNTTTPAMRTLGMRIKVSQEDEMNMMRKWLADHGAAIPGPHAHHEAGGFMPGMLTTEEMDKLAAAKGTEFDRLFLRGMIRHHGGALRMVEDLFKTPGAGQEGGIFAFANDVEADQRMEIERMGLLLKELEK